MSRDMNRHLLEIESGTRKGREGYRVTWAGPEGWEKGSRWMGWRVQ